MTDTAPATSQSVQAASGHQRRGIVPTMRPIATLIAAMAWCRLTGNCAAAIVINVLVKYGAG